jgi:UDP-N-acetylglucosamine 4,6-dehydratase
MSNITRLPFDWTKKTVMVTGGTGSFGRVFVRSMLDKQKAAKVIVFSRDELKQHEMRVSGFDDPRLRYFIGDIRDRERLTRAMKGVDVVVHAAALKQVVACEYNPIEAVMTNVNGSRNVVDAALDAGVSRVLALSTDKAVNPANLYGATKLVAEKLFVQGNAYRGDGPTRMACVRYGNVVGSRGSVVPLFSQQRPRGELTITDPNMTRFWLTLDQGVAFVTSCIERMHGGEVFVPKLKTMNIVDLAHAMAPECRIKTVGIRPGEKLHEALLSEEENSRTLDVGDMYVVRPSHPWWPEAAWEGAPVVPQDFSYVSNTAPDRLSVDELMKMIANAA